LINLPSEFVDLNKQEAAAAVERRRRFSFQGAIPRVDEKLGGLGGQ
jgi:hypothetical protein